MAKFELPRAAQPSTHRLVPEESKSEAFHRDALEGERTIQGRMEGLQRLAEKNQERSVSLQRLATAPERHPVDEIAALIRALTYGDMIVLADGIWNAQVEGSEMSKDIMPSVLHRWSTSCPARGPSSPE
jgi:hypothetical protein